jgi:CubicO group peptidase (beta-lactamase class C family)
LRLPDACGRVVRAAQAESRLPSVAAAVWRGGEELWADAVGVADVATGEPARSEHAYRIASITKSFTAAAVFQLREAGALSLDEPLDLPGLTRAPLPRRLLSHLSGLQRETPGADWATGDLPSAAEVIERLGTVEQVLDPGEEWHYSNLAYVLLGEAVARASGLEYERYVEERLLAPLGLGRTTYDPSEPAATGYFVDPYSDGATVQPILGGATASGGLWSTVGDLCRWGSFLASPDGAVLTETSADAMHRFQAMADLEQWTLGFGLGLMLWRRDDRVFAGHAGAHAGFLAHLVWDRESRTVAAVATNSGAGVAIDQLGLDVLTAALDAEPREPDPWTPAEQLPPELEGVLGRWWSEGNEFVFRFRDGRLEAIGEGGRVPAVFEREGEDVYRGVGGRERGERLVIERGDDGVPVRLLWSSYPFTRAPSAF